MFDLLPLNSPVFSSGYPSFASNDSTTLTPSARSFLSFTRSGGTSQLIIQSHFSLLVKRAPSSLATSHSFSRQNISTTSRLTNTPNSSSLAPTLGLCNTDIFTIASPSLAYATTLYFKSGFNVQIKVQDDEPEDSILIRFRRAVMKAGIFQELKRRRRFENKQDKKNRKTREAARKNSKRLARPKPQAKQGTPKKEYNYKDDNWELLEGDLPYCKD